MLKRILWIVPLFFVAAVPAFAYTEVGENDFRISQMGTDGVSAPGTPEATTPAVAFNSDDNQYLVVWSGRAETSGDSLIWGRMVDGATGQPVGGQFPISDPGADALHPKVAYNATAGEYLVVWQSQAEMDGREIVGQRVAPNTLKLAANFPISEMGPVGSTTTNAFRPDVVYNPDQDEYLVVWSGNDSEFDDRSIFAQRLDGDTGAEVGLDDYGLSILNSFRPRIVYNPVTTEYMAVWGWFNTADSLTYLRGQRLNANGSQIGDNDFLISTNGYYLPTVDDFTRSFHFVGDHYNVAVNTSSGAYFVTWLSRHDAGEFDIYAQRLDSGAAEVGDDDFPLTDTNPTGDPSYGYGHPDVLYNPVLDEFLVTFSGEQDGIGCEFSGRYQRVAADGSPIGDATMLTDEQPASCFSPVIVSAYNPVEDEVFTAFQDVRSDPPEVAGGDEIFGQRLAINAAPTIDPIADQAGEVGEEVSLQVVASDNDTLTYSATGLPDGLSIDPSTGLISGTLSAMGSFSVTVTATDDGTPQESASESFTWEVAGSVAVNGDFEAGDLQWTEFGVGNGLLCLTANCLYLFDADAQLEFIRQDLTESGSAGETVTMSFSTGGRGLTDGTVAASRIILFYTDDTQGVVTCPIVLSGDFGPQVETCAITAEKDFDAIAYGIGRLDTEAGIFAVDDITLRIE